MSWEIKGTTGSLESFPYVSYQSRVSAPKNPKLIREVKKPKKVCSIRVFFLQRMEKQISKMNLILAHTIRVP